MGRLQTVYAAQANWPPDRAALIARERHIGLADGSRTVPSRRTARRAGMLADHRLLSDMDRGKHRGLKLKICALAGAGSPDRSDVAATLAIAVSRPRIGELPTLLE
jgi:hypothetical protein